MIDQLRDPVGSPSIALLRSAARSAFFARHHHAVDRDVPDRADFPVVAGARAVAIRPAAAAPHPVVGILAVGQAAGGRPSPPSQPPLQFGQSAARTTSAGMYVFGVGRPRAKRSRSASSAELAGGVSDSSRSAGAWRRRRRRDRRRPATGWKFAAGSTNEIGSSARPAVRRVRHSSKRERNGPSSNQIVNEFAHAEHTLGLGPPCGRASRESPAARRGFGRNGGIGRSGLAAQTGRNDRMERIGGRGRAATEDAAPVEQLTQHAKFARRELPAVLATRKRWQLQLAESAGRKLGGSLLAFARPWFSAAPSRRRPVRRCRR